ncbi:MAG: glycosyltransferase family A protein [Desulfuromusa sp.]|nr:glycosyltransferase family A protein [Desulfuromusa sp.]
MKPLKYLKTRAITSPWQISGASRTDFSAAVIIPALAERENLPATLDSLCLSPAEYLDRTLVVIVVNNRVDIVADQLADNRKTIDWLRTNPYPQLNLVWIDASISGLELPAKDGVGLARKIGFDASLKLLDWQAEPLLISLDADTLVDRYYLKAIFDHFEISTNGAAVIPFRHQSIENTKQEVAIRHYELYLRSYLFGLLLADSPYAYHSIGSTFACLAEAYIGAGGMNRRCGGEDFYFLQQLTKTSGIEMISGTVVHPSPRFSNRVPFGTGKAVQGQVECRVALFQFVPVAGFEILKLWLALISCQLNRSADQIVLRVPSISPVLHEFLIELNFVQVWEKLQNNHSSKKQRLAAFHDWFDALRTRQLLTRIESHSNSSAEQIVAELLRWGGYPGVEKEADQLELLEGLQGVEWE